MERNRSVIVCLGGELEKEWPSEKFRARLDKAYELFTPDTHNGIIVTSKGTYRDPYPHTITEAEAGRQYLEERGVDLRYLLIEDQSMDTVGNAFFTRVRYLNPKRWLNPTIITNQFHIPLARFLFEIVLDENYTPDFVSAPNAGISDDELQRWQKHEAEMLNFYQGIFDGVRRGDIACLEHYIYHRDPAYAGVVDKEHQELTERISAIWN